MMFVCINSIRHDFLLIESCVWGREGADTSSLSVIYINNRKQPKGINMLGFKRDETFAERYAKMQKDGTAAETAEIQKLAEAKQLEEAVNIESVIKELIDTSFGGSNESQMKSSQLIKGLATSDDPKSNKFMQALDKFTSGLNMDDFK